MDITQTQANPQRKTRRIPRPTALGTLAVIGVIAILASTVAAPILGWRYYRNTQAVALSQEVTAAWASHWAEAKDADGKTLTAPVINGIVHYPAKSFLFLYTDPATGKQAAMVWMGNEKLEAEALKNIWVPLAVQEPPAATEAGK